MCVCVCVSWFGLSVWVSSNITSVTHTYIHRLKHADRLHHAHNQHNSVKYTHTFHSWRMGRFLRVAGSTGKMSGQTHTYAYRHTTEHFQPTMLTLYSFPEPFYLHAGQMKERLPVEHHQEARLGGFRTSVMSAQGCTHSKTWTLIKIQSQMIILSQ